MNKKNSLVFFGSEQLSSSRTASECHIFKMLVADGYTIERLIIKGKPQKGRIKRNPPIVTIAELNNIPVSVISNKQELQEQTAKLTSDIAVLVAFGFIIDQKIIDSFKHGILNIHPSLLPKYRGTTPIETTILRGDTTTGVTLMNLSAEMDAGDVYDVSEFAIEKEEITKAELTNSLDSLGAKMLKRSLPGIIAGSITGTPQNENAATFTQMLSKKDSILDLNKPAAELEKEIRAYADWPGSSINIGGIDLQITSAHHVPTNSGDGIGTYKESLINENILMLETGRGSLCVDSLKPAGKKLMNTKDFIAGYGSRLSQ